MHDRQRLVVVVALGGACVIGASTVNRLLARNEGRWFAYAPNTGEVFDGSHGTVWRDALVWLGAVAIWAAASLWPLRGRGSDDG